MSKFPPSSASGLSRRELLLTGALATAAVSTAKAGASSDQVRLTAQQLLPPFDSMRDYVMALNAHGLLQHFDQVNQDEYECTAIMYQLVDEFGLRDAPAVLFTNLRANSRNYLGPVVANLQGNVATEALLLGTDIDKRDPLQTYRNAKQKMLELLESTAGEWPQIPPQEIDPANAPCKEVVLTGDDIDVTAFPFLKGNPGDGGAYINTASVFTRDPDMGVNLGTYRCQIKAARKVMVNFEDGQTGIKMVNAAKKRGEKSIPVSLVVGQDPMTWMVSSSRIPSRIGKFKPIDELAIAGGLRGEAVEVVRTEDGVFQVPAHAEIVIEGSLDLYNLEEEGPYHEMFGYLGHKKSQNYVLTVNTVTHRKDPWVMNSFTGVVQEYITAPQDAASLYRLRKSSPQVMDYHSPNDSKGLTYISIKKDAPGQALKIARPIAMFSPLSRITIVVDDDIDVLDSAAVRFAMGSRWQPALATEIIEGRMAFPLDPASPDRKTTSKIIIDATRQWPEEGGPAEYQQLNRDVFEAARPQAIEQVTARWPDKLLKR